MSVVSVDAVTSLAQNIALLLSLTLLYSVVWPYAARIPNAVQPLVAGVLFGIIATAAMHTPFVIAPGVIGDARLIAIVLAGPFGGPAAALTAALMAAAYRAGLGGAGAVAGVGSILTAGLFGAVVGAWWRRRRPRSMAFTFLVLGLALDAIVLGWALALPDAALAQRVLGAAAVPMGLFLPFGTLVLGMLLVHEQQRHEERERLTLMQLAIERSTEAMFWVDATGRIVNANGAAASLTGYTRDELLDAPIWQIDVQTSPQGWRMFWASVRAGAQHVDRYYRRRDDVSVPVETSNDFVSYRGREWVSVFARDVTERRRIEEERAEQLTREQALRVRAEEANVLKEQFLATVSHELRTPLTSILAYARLLRRGALPPGEADRALATIERNALAQVQMVEDLLEASSALLGTLRIDRRPVVFSAIVEGEVQAASIAAEQAGVELHSEVPSRFPPVAGDARRLQQIVRNLLANAIKFTPAGGRVRVRLDRVDDDARLVVSDTGAGIPPAFLPHVFERFRQADSSLTRAYGGLGVGLAVVRALVESHGGSALAESPGLGAGTTVTVRLPLAATDQPDGTIGEPCDCSPAGR